MSIVESARANLSAIAAELARAEDAARRLHREHEAAVVALDAALEAEVAAGQPQPTPYEALLAAGRALPVVDGRRAAGLYEHGYERELPDGRWTLALTPPGREVVTRGTPIAPDHPQAAVVDAAWRAWSRGAL